MPKKATHDTPSQATGALAAVEAIKERFGESAIMRLGETKSVKVEVISTGAISLDIALGVRGIPRGRIVEIYGPEASGKSTLAQHIVAQAQRMGGTAAYVDAEHALDPSYAKRIGVNTDDLLISQPDTGEQALEIVETLVRSNAVDVVVIDSVAALTPRAEIEGDMGDQHMGLQARLMSQALRKLTSVVAKSKTAVIFINQIRMKIGVFFGNPETTPGGMALKFYSSVRIEVRRAAQIKQLDRIIGNRVKAKIVKNKVAAPFRNTEFDILYNHGISVYGDLLDTAVLLGVAQKAGNAYAFGETKLGMGRSNVTKVLHDDAKLADAVRKEVWKAVEVKKSEED